MNSRFVEEDGGVFWDSSAGLGRARSQGIGGDIIRHLRFDKTHKRDPDHSKGIDEDDHDLDPPSELLQRADQFLIGKKPAFRAWDHEAGELGDTARPEKQGRILLLIPGMFVHGETLTAQLSKASGNFLGRAACR